jgi:uncharacterized protein YndB with AHSA1/START domain
MIRRLQFAGIVCVAFAASVAAQDIKNTSYVAADKTRVLQHSVVIPATLPAIWEAFTTTEGVKSWAVPVASVDFRVGGIWESSYSRTAGIGAPGNIKNKFLSYIPMKMLSIQAINAPPTFQHPEVLAEIFTVVEFEELGPKSVRLTSSMVGFKNTEAHDAVYRFFESGNASSMKSLYQRFVNGPANWNR